MMDYKSLARYQVISNILSWITGRTRGGGSYLLGGTPILGHGREVPL